MPPPNDDELSRILREYLTEEKDAKRRGYTIANVLSLLQSIERNQRGMNARISGLEVSRDEIHDTIDTHGARIAHHAQEIVTIKRRLRRDDDDEEMSTGRFDVEEIKRELAAARQKRADSERAKAEDVTWWKRSIIGWSIAVLGFIATTAITILITLAIVGARAPAAAPNEVRKELKP